MSNDSKDTEVAFKAFSAASAAVFANNATKRPSERGNVPWNAFLITIIFFWFRAFYVYWKYVTQWSDVKELGVGGKLWKAAWPVIAVLTPLFMVKAGVIANQLHGNSLLALGLYTLPTLYFFAIYPFFLDRKHFFADRKAALTNRLGRSLYFIAFAAFYGLLAGFGMSSSWVTSGLPYVGMANESSPHLATNRPHLIAKRSVPLDINDHTPATVASEKSSERLDPTVAASGSMPVKTGTGTIVNEDTLIEAEDIRLNRIWKEIRAMATPTAFKPILRSQRTWLKQRDKCPSKGCVLDLYRKRNVELERLAVVLGNDEPINQPD